MVSVPEHTMDEVPLQEDDEKTIEYRMFMVYAQRSLPESKFSALQKAASPRGDHMAISNGKEEKAKAEAKLPDKEHKKKGWPRKLTPACLRPPKSKKKINGAPGEKTAKDPEEEKARSIISRVQQIVRRIKQQEKENGYRMVRRVSSIQQDGDDEDEIIANIVHILRTTGDQLNDQIIKEKTLVEKIKDLWSYDFYKRVTDCFLLETVTISDTEEEQQKSKIALCLHATTALTTLDNQPMNKVLGFGAQYLRENYSPWIQSRGGWEKVMGIETDEEEIE